MLVLGIVTAFTFTFLFLPGLGHARGRKHHVPPWSMMKTLDQIPPTWSQILDASDGKKGDICNSSRFECVMGGDAVLDKETGLTWATDANMWGKVKWQAAIDYCSILSLGDRKGWRLPTREELASLLDMSSSGSPLLPSGHPFEFVQPSQYWSITVDETEFDEAWIVHMGNGNVLPAHKSQLKSVWPVRGGN